MNLTPSAARVLGCLIEKQHTTPDYYPMTVNALTAASNQKTSRDPVMDLDESDVNRALDELRGLELVAATRVSGGRSVKYKHRLDQVMERSTHELSALAVLILRGPQTIGEVRGRTERYVEFDDLDHVGGILAGLADRSLVRELARQPGEKESRWEQLLGASDAASTTPTEQWNYLEFPVADPAQVQATRAFFADVFGWSYQEWGEGYVDTSDGGLDSGISADPEIAHIPLPVFYTDDLDGLRARVEAAGAEITRETFEFPGGRRFHFREPSGNVLAAWTKLDNE